MNYCTMQNHYQTTTDNSKRTHLNGFFHLKPFFSTALRRNLLHITHHPKNRLFYDLLYSKRTQFIKLQNVISILIRFVIFILNGQTDKNIASNRTADGA